MVLVPRMTTFCIVIFIYIRLLLFFVRRDVSMLATFRGSDTDVAHDQGGLEDPVLADSARASEADTLSNDSLALTDFPKVVLFAAPIPGTFVTPEDKVLHDIREESEEVCHGQLIAVEGIAHLRHEHAMGRKRHSSRAVDLAGHIRPRRSVWPSVRALSIVACRYS